MFVFGELTFESVSGEPPSSSGISPSGSMSGRPPPSCSFSFSNVTVDIVCWLLSTFTSNFF